MEEVPDLFAAPPTGQDNRREERTNNCWTNKHAAQGHIIGLKREFMVTPKRTISINLKPGEDDDDNDGKVPSCPVGKVPKWRINWVKFFVVAVILGG